MAYLIFATQQDADSKARSDWEAVLGRPKNPGDVTEFLWGRTEPGLDGKVACIIPDEFTPEKLGISAENIAVVNGDDAQVITVDPKTGEQTIEIIQRDPLITADTVDVLDTVNWPANPSIITGKV